MICYACDQQPVGTRDRRYFYPEDAIVPACRRHADSLEKVRVLKSHLIKRTAKEYTSPEGKRIPRGSTVLYVVRAIGKQVFRVEHWPVVLVAEPLEF